MQIWCDLRNHSTLDFDPNDFDSILSTDPSSCFYTEGSNLIKNQKNIGSIVNISSTEGQDFAKGLVGLAQWIVLEFDNWKMIPIENLIAICEGTGTKIAAKITKSVDVPGAAFALDKGIDAILINPKKELIDAAKIAKFQRQEQYQEYSADDEYDDQIIMTSSLISSISNIKNSARYCIDLTTVLQVGEGVLVGSSASSLALVHGETIPSEFVPTRPFRINAGSPHSYILMNDGKTKYISELNSGDEICIVKENGECRTGIIGRLKIEKRPFLQICWENNNDKPSNIFLQQAETVKLACPNNQTIAVTEIKPGDKILTYNNEGKRHIGMKISSDVEER